MKKTPTSDCLHMPNSELLRITAFVAKIIASLNLVSFFVMAEPSTFTKYWKESGDICK